MKLTVDLAERSYDIHIGKGVFALAIEHLHTLKKQNVKIVCIADSNVLKAHPQKAQAMCDIAKIIEVSGGEKSKCFEKASEICSRLAQMGFDRKGHIVAWGGGVIGDLAGFVASIFMRGVKFFQIPTTLLSMVDSSVGGKTGINIAEGKNLVGAFHQPQAVFADIDFLQTLPKREFAAGMAEVIKCGVLGDEKLFEDIATLQEALNPEHWYLPEAIRRSCVLKAQVVASDERETAASGGRALLNLGHTFAHALEKTAGYGKFLHGEAVAIGMVMACKLSVKLGFDDCQKRIEKVLSDCNLPVSADYNTSLESFMEAMSHDKKNSGGRLRFVLIESIGKTRTDFVENALVADVVREYFN